jgi:diacylglycerol kinase family enzyme
MIVINAASDKGEVLDAKAKIERACKTAGRRFRIYEIGSRKQMSAIIHQAVGDARASQGVVVASGGDGTINAVVQATLGSGCAFGVIPQGTFNYFSRTHGIPSDTGEAMQVLLTHRPQATQVGLINDRVFLVNASIGLYARVLEDREAFKAEYGRHRWVALWSGLLTVLRHERPWHLHMAWGEGRRDMQTRTLFVANNALQMHQVGLPEATAVEHSQLAAIAIKPRGLWSMLGLLARGAIGRLGEADSVVSFPFESLIVESPRKARRVKVATDGEIGWMRMPLHFGVAPEPLWLIRPDVAPELERSRR